MQSTRGDSYATWPEPVAERRLLTYKAICKRIDECNADLRGLYAVPWQMYKPQIRNKIIRAKQLRRQLEAMIDQIDRALSGLNDPETRVIYELYFDGEARIDMARALACTTSQIECIRKSAIHKLTDALIQT